MTVVSRRREGDNLASVEPRSFVPVLICVVLVVSMISSLGAPLLPSVAQVWSVSLSTAQWSLTVALLSGAVAAPILGRLGDGRHGRDAMLGALLVTTLGGVIAGLAPDFWLLLLGRAMQGIGLGLQPIAMASARDHLPDVRARQVIAVLSVTGAAGVGAGYPVSGLIDQELGVHAAFLFGAVLSALAMSAVFLAVPASRRSSSKPVDLIGAGIGGIGIVALLVGIAQGGAWGWSSGPVLACFAVAAVVLAIWVLTQLRFPEPLVDLHQLRHRAVLGANLAAVLLGFALYTFLTVITEFVQTPSTAGFGFGMSTLMAGVCLIPFSIFSLLASRAMAVLAGRFQVRTFLVVGSLAIAATGAFFALVHDAFWQACVMTGLLGVGFGFTFAAIPGLITRAVPTQEAGSAMGFYQVIRSVGFSIGSAAVASILAASEMPGSDFPKVGGYTLALWIGAGACLLAAATSLLFTPREGAGPPADPNFGRDDAELAAAGLIDADFEP